MQDESVLARAARFLEGHARLLEQRLFRVTLEGAPPETVRAAVAAYGNPDGGFGWALEPDVRAGGSQPLFCQVAFRALRDAGLSGDAACERAAAWLASVADGAGAVPYLLADAADHDRANHWNGDFAFAPSLLATAAVTAGLHALGIESAWLTRATDWCLAEIGGEPLYSGARLRNVLDLLEHMPPHPDGDALWARATGRLFEADYVLLETPVTTYGLTPLHFAPTPASRARALFADEVVEAHLDDLAQRQQDDGGWPIHWTPPDGAAHDEWRGVWTLEALTTLRAYGRL